LSQAIERVISSSQHGLIWRFSRIRVYAAQILLLSGSRVGLRTTFLAPSEGFEPAAVDAATAIGGRFQLALAWLTTGALLGVVLPVLGVVVIAAFNAFCWLPIRGESPRQRPS
jgi:hypothetical protein